MLVLLLLFYWRNTMMLLHMISLTKKNKKLNKGDSPIPDLNVQNYLENTKLRIHGKPSEKIPTTCLKHHKVFFIIYWGNA